MNNQTKVLQMYARKKINELYPVNMKEDKRKTIKLPRLTKFDKITNHMWYLDKELKS